MKNSMNYGDTSKLEGIEAKDSKMLKPGAREIFNTGTNTQARDMTKKPNYGKGGVKGFAS